MYLDSRELQEEFNELESELEALKEEFVDAKTLEEKEDAAYNMRMWEKDNLERYKLLKDFINRMENEPDWNYGLIFISEDEFEDYTQQYCEDTGLIDRNMPSFIEIDWEKTAENFSDEFNMVEFDGEYYYYRN